MLHFICEVLKSSRNTSHFWICSHCFSYCSQYNLKDSTTFQLAVTNGFGGHHSKEKAKWLIGATEQWLKENGMYACHVFRFESGTAKVYCPQAACGAPLLRSNAKPWDLGGCETGAPSWGGGGGWGLPQENLA